MGKRGSKPKFDHRSGEIIAFYEAGHTIDQTAKHFGCSGPTIHRIFRITGHQQRDTKIEKLLAVKDEIARFYEDGHTAEETATRFGCSTGIIFIVFERAGITRKENRVDKLEGIKDEIVAYYQSGKSIAETCQRYACAPKTVMKFLKESGAGTRERGDAVSLSWKQGIRSETFTKMSIEPYRAAEMRAIQQNTKQQEFDFGPRHYCRRCKQDVPETSWYFYPDGRRLGYCNPCWSDYNKRYSEKKKQYYQDHKKEFLLRGKKNYYDLKSKTLSAYGGRCDCCGETQPEFLAVDHVHGGGNEHHKELRSKSLTSNSFHRWLKKIGYPAEFRLLCHDCNRAISIHGTCPHQTGPSLPQLYYHLSGRERRLARLKFNNRRNREITINGYGGRCTCCGEDRYEFLTIDHVNDDGNIHRAKLKEEGKNFQMFVASLPTLGFPPEFRVQCYNCNIARGMQGICPHARVI